MTRKLVWYSHRYTCGGTATPEERAENLRRARERFEQMRVELLAGRGEILWAPWIQMAEAGVPDIDVWPAISYLIPMCRAIVVDMDGGPEAKGQEAEREMAEGHGAEVRVVKWAA